MYGGMDVRDVPTRLKEIPDLLRTLGSSNAALARFINLDPSSMSKTFKGERGLTAQEAIDIADFVTRLETNQESGVAEEISRRASNFRPPMRAGPGATTERALVPLFGFRAAGPLDRIELKRGREIDFIDTGDLVSNPANAIALRVPGDELMPRYRPGEVVIAIRNLPPSRGKDCIVEFPDGSATLRTFAHRSKGLYHLEYWALSDADKERAVFKSEAVNEEAVAALHQIVVTKPG